MPRSSIFSILLLLICLALPSFSRDVYIDSESTSSEPSGSQANPYSSLQQLITILEDPETNEGIQVYLKPRSTVYKISNSDIFLFDGSNNGELSITAWHSDPLHVQNETDCASLPIIDGSEINLDLESLNILNFTSIKFINMKGSIQVKNSKAVFLNDLCLDDLPSVSDSFFNLEETSNLTVHRVIATVSNGTEIIKYTHTKSTNIDQKVSIKDLTLLLINNTNKLSADTLNESYFKFILNNPNSLSATKNTLSLSRISLQGKGTSQVFPVFLSVYGWDNVNINKLDISNQDFIANRGGVLEFNGVGKLNVSDTYFYHNVIFSQSLLNLKEKISFFYLKNCGSLSYFNTTFEKNYISGVQDIETNFRFMLSDVLSSITVNP